MIKMEKDKHSRGSPASTAARVFTLLLVICLVECATEQRINRGSKPSNLLEKINGWRSQRGGSCLSYGHSCWGAHGKRSGKPPAAAPDWYLTRMLRRMIDNADMKHSQRVLNNEDLNAIFRVDQANDTPSEDKLLNGSDGALDLPFSRIPDSKPMLGENLLSQMKIWQMMRETSGDK